MNILIVSQYYWPENFMVTGLAEELQRRGHTVSVLTGHPNYPKGEFYTGYYPFRRWLRRRRKDHRDFSNAENRGDIPIEKHNGVSVHRVWIWARGKNLLGLVLNYLSFVVSAVLYSIFWYRDSHDVIFCYAPSPATACLPAIFLRGRSKKKLLFWIQDLWPESIAAVAALPPKLAETIFGGMMKFFYSHCDEILIPSEGFRRSVLHWAQDKAKQLESRIKLVPNWADPFPELVERPAWLKDLPQGFRVVFAGNLGKAQNLSLLIQAADLLKESHPDVQWIVAGEGSERIWLQQQILQRRLQAVVHWVGQKPYADMLPFFQCADALYVSLNDEPIFSLTIPTKVQAYMSSGKPLLASLRGGGAELIGRIAKCGFVAEPNSPQSLVKALLELKGLESSKRLQLGLNGKNYFEQNFTRSKVIDQIEDLMRKAH